MTSRAGLMPLGLGAKKIILWSLEIKQSVFDFPNAPPHKSDLKFSCFSCSVVLYKINSFKSWLVKWILSTCLQSYLFIYLFDWYFNERIVNTFEKFYCILWLAGWRCFDKISIKYGEITSDLYATFK